MSFYSRRRAVLRTKGLVLVSAVSGLILSACGASAGSLRAGQQPGQLHQAAQAMLDLKNMTASVTTSGPSTGQGSGPPQKGILYYEAPDSFETLVAGPNGLSVSLVAVAGHVYIADPTHPGYFLAAPVRPNQSPAETILGPFRALAQAKAVDQHGDTYRITVPAPKPSRNGAPSVSGQTIQATVKDGLIPTLVIDYSLRGRGYEVAYGFSGLNSSPAVSAPPADRILATPPGSQPPPACAPGQHSTASCTPQYHPVTLPPVGPVSSTLQFRPVLDAHAVGCGAPSGQDPNPSATVTLTGIQPGSCSRLGPSALTVTRAHTTATQDQSGQVQLDFTLDPGDAASFDQLAQANYQRQVAVVMFGQILSAPTINAISFGGQGQITGVTLDQAARAAAALAGN